MMLRSVCLAMVQLWLRMVVMTFFMLCLVLLWLIGPGWCPSEQFSWLGLMPMQVRPTIQAFGKKCCRFHILHDHCEAVC